MAAKRISSSSINWAAFAERLLAEEMQYFQALKGRNDSYIRRIAANPETLPKIDWNQYKSKITIPGLVDSFQKSYEGLNIPYPSDQGLISKIDQEENKMNADAKNLIQTANEKIAALKEKLAKLEANIPYSEMTVEEYYIACPENAVYPYAPPTMFPHGPEEREFTKKLIESGQL